jgi:mRNA interferase MazF
VVRGEVFRVRARAVASSGAARLGVIVLADEFLALSTVLVSPTSRSAEPSSFRPEIEVGGEQVRVLTEQTTAMAPELLGAPMGRLSTPEQRAVDEALRSCSASSAYPVGSGVPR